MFATKPGGLYQALALAILSRRIGRAGLGPRSESKVKEERGEEEKSKFLSFLWS